MSRTNIDNGRKKDQESGSCDLRYLLTAYLFDNISAAGRREVEAQLEANPDCRAQLEELRQTLYLVEYALEDETPAEGEEGEDDESRPAPAVYRFEERRLRRVLEASKGPRLRAWTVWASAAAALLFVGFLGVMSWMQMSGDTGGRADLAMTRAPDEGVYDVTYASVEQEKDFKSGDARSAIGVGGGVAGAYGNRHGKGNLPREPQATGGEGAGAATKSPPSLAFGDLDGDDVGDLVAPGRDASATTERVKLLENRTLGRPATDPAKPAAPPAASVPRSRTPPSGAKRNFAEYAQRAGTPLQGASRATPAQQAPAEEEKAAELDSLKVAKEAPPFIRGDAADDAPADRMTWSAELPSRPPAVALDPRNKEAGKSDGSARWGSPFLPGRVEGETSERDAAAAGQPGARDWTKTKKRPAGTPDLAGAEAERPTVTRKVDGITMDIPEGLVINEINALPELQRLQNGETVVDQLRQLEAQGQDKNQMLRRDLESIHSELNVDLSQDARDGKDDVQATVTLRNDNAKFALPADTPAATEAPAADAESPVGGGAVAKKEAETEKSLEALKDGRWALFGGSRPATGSGPSGPPGGYSSGPSALEQEKLLRSFSYYRSLDNKLSLKNFVTQSLSIPLPVVGDEGLGEKAFRERYGVNPFVATERDNQSTFGMDVSTAAFHIARNYLLNMGRLPPPQKMRVEEFVNAFPEEPEVAPDQVFSVFTEGGPSPFGAGLELLKITVASREPQANERKDLILTFAVDASGSMAKDEHLRVFAAALKGLVKSLRPTDRVGLVAFSNHAYVVLPHTAVRERDRILAAIDSLGAQGGTNVESGLDLAYRLADESLEPRAVHRVVLCSDGIANLGARAPDDILRKVKAYKQRGIYLTVLGIGGTRDEKGLGDRMLVRLATEGNGSYHYVTDAHDTERLLRNELTPAKLQVLARDAKIQVEFNRDVVSHYRLLGYEKRDVADKDFRNDAIDAGEVGGKTNVTVLYEILRRRGGAGSLGRIYLRYYDTTVGKVDEVNYDLPQGVLARDLSATSDRFRFVACVAELAELLRGPDYRGSYYARDGSFSATLAVLGGLSAQTRSQESFRTVERMVSAARSLTHQKLLQALRAR